MLDSLARIEKSFVANVGEPFEIGVLALGQMVENIVHLRTNASIAKVRAKAEQIKNLAKDACSGMRKADQEAMKVKNELDKLIEESVNEKGKMKRSLSEKRLELDASKRSLDGLKDEEEQLQSELSQAKRSLDNAEGSLADAKDKVEKKKKEKTVLTVVGFCAGGLIGGLVALAVLEGNVKSAERTVDVAAENESSARRRFYAKASQLSHIENKITALDKESRDLENQLKKIEREIETLCQHRNKQVKVSEEVKKCANFIAVTFGRTTVMKDSTIEIYNFEPIIEPLKSLAEHFSAHKLLGNSLFSRAINFGDVTSKLKMICSQSSFHMIDDEEISDFI